MVQKSPGAVVTKMVLVRLFWFVFVLIVGFLSAQPFVDLVSGVLHFEEKCGLFCIPGFETGILGLLLSYSFWMGAVFGALGKKADYVLISGLFVLVFWLFTQEDGRTWQIFMALIILTLLGNVIGYLLKLARQKFFKDSWIGR